MDSLGLGRSPIIRQGPGEVTISTDDYLRIVDKACKYDALDSTSWTKAKKWDESQKQHHPFKLIPDEIIDKISEWQEKAKKYDELWNVDRTLNYTQINEWIEKAKKWDSLVRDLNISYPNIGALHNVVEKAKKWDFYMQDDTPISVMSIKARKWDELVTGFEIHESSDPMALRVMIKEYREKAQKWDYHQTIQETGNYEWVDRGGLKRLQKDVEDLTKLLSKHLAEHKIS